jgi:ABC-type protease/lipase transport system fused ATPase/permease subunit
LRAIRRESRMYYWAVAVFSFFVNLLMLTGPLYMLQVYDRVLGSRSEATLIALTLLVIFLYAMMGLLDFVRGRIMGRVGARFQARLDRRVFEAVVRRSAIGANDHAATGLRDLESVQKLITSPVLMAGFDIPWTPVFLFGIAIFHPWLAILAVSGGAVLIFIALLNQILTQRPQAQANMAGFQSETLSQQIRSEAEMIRSLGMTGAAFERWHEARNKSLVEQLKTADLGGGFLH